MKTKKRNQKIIRVDPIFKKGKIKNTFLKITDIRTLGDSWEYQINTGYYSGWMEEDRLIKRVVEELNKQKKCV